MARIRSLKPEFWADEDLADLPRDARLLYMGLWNLSDEHGRLRGDARYVKGQLFPYDDDLDAAAIDKLLDLLAVARKLVRYESASRSYLWLPNLAKHQRLEPDKVPSKLPDPSDSSQCEIRADKSAPDADESESGAKDHALLYGSGSMEHVAGSMEHGGAARARPRATRTRADAEFDRFWEIYPRREAKGTARKAWDKAILRADPDRILEAAKRYRDLPGRDPKFTAHPATWLNGDRWTDEPSVRGSPSGYVEVGGLKLTAETAERMTTARDRMAAMDAQRLAIEGPT